MKTVNENISMTALLLIDKNSQIKNGDYLKPALKSGDNGNTNELDSKMPIRKVKL